MERHLIPSVDGFDALQSLPAQAIACNNWSDAYPYAPNVDFRLGHDENSLYLSFEVEENALLAAVDKDFGEVWTDSCVEFFIAFDDKGYYNLETNCIGKSLLAFRKSRTEAEPADAAIMASVKRTPSLGREPFAERSDNPPYRWTMEIEIPKEAFFRHQIASFNGLDARINLYKCGDNLSCPHYLSWKPIETATPNFHCPEFFVPVRFE